MAGRRQMRRAARTGGMRLSIVAASAGLALSAAGSAGAATTRDWPSYLNGPAHTSYSPGETTTTSANGAKLASRWRFLGDLPTRPGQPGRGFLASPTVFGGDRSEEHTSELQSPC